MAAKKIESSTPLDPPVARSRRSPSARHRAAGSAWGSRSRSARTARAPSAKVEPVSPSPTRASRALSEASAAISARPTASIRAATTASREGAGAGPPETPSGSGRTTGSRRIRARGQAVTGVSERSAASRASSSARKLREAPCMSSAVMTGEGPSRSRTRRPRSVASTAFVSTAISRAVVEPRLLTRSASLSAPAMGAGKRAAMRAASASARGRSMRSMPGSPWMPRPSSASPSCKRGSGFEPGIVAVETAMPRVRTAAAVRRASAATSASGAPEAAAWPAALWTKSVPASPRGRAASGRAMSSATSTVSTRRPSARARSAARPKFRRSPA